MASWPHGPGRPDRAHPTGTALLPAPTTPARTHTGPPRPPRHPRPHHPDPGCTPDRGRPPVCPPHPPVPPTPPPTPPPPTTPHPPPAPTLGAPLTHVGRLYADHPPVSPQHRPAPGQDIQVFTPDLPQATPTDPPRFLLDVHLGTLARRLRLLGLDTIYDNDRDDLSLLQ